MYKPKTEGAESQEAITERSFRYGIGAQKDITSSIDMQKSGGFMSPMVGMGKGARDNNKGNLQLAIDEMDTSVQ